MDSFVGSVFRERETFLPLCIYIRHENNERGTRIRVSKTVDKRKTRANYHS